MIDFAQLKDKNIAILWFGLEGKSTLRFLMDHHIDFKNITILDANKDLDSHEHVKAVTGKEYTRNLGQYDVIFKSSGIPISEELLPHQDKILTQVQLFFDNYQGKVIAVTASKGKSTMVSLTYALLKNAGYNTKLVGNIGTPVFDEIDLDTQVDFVVIELSSYMLQNLRKKNYISILWTIFPEHLDRHGSFDKYVGAKLNILNNSEINIVYEWTLQNYNLEEKYTNLIPYGRESRYSRSHNHFTRGEKQLFPTTDRKIPGDHNLENITAIIALADVLKISDDVLHQTVRDFQWLPHRLQEVGESGGIRRIDDAISTTPESTIQAIKSFEGQIDTIFLGGTDRGYVFDQLATYIYKNGIKNIVLFPNSGKRILEALDRWGIWSLKILETSSMQEAVKFAYKHTQKGKICMLSTASPSYSIWQNFEEKWDLFQQYIKEDA